MVASKQLSPGMTIQVDGRILRVESCVKVTVGKGLPFMKAKLRDLISEETLEKSFNMDQDIEEVSLKERRLEFLYPEGNEYLFLDVDELDQVSVPSKIIADKINFLKEGVQIKATYYGSSIFSIDLPQFLELMVQKTEAVESSVAMASANKIAVLETGAKIEVPLFIETGDVIKVDTTSSEYVQRI